MSNIPKLLEKVKKLRLSKSATTDTVTASTGLVTASTDPSAEEGLFIPSRREKRYETLRVSDFMSLRGTGAGRDHLRPKAPPEGPLAVWHKLTARPISRNRQCIPQSSRGLCLCSRNMRRQVCGLRQRFRRALHRMRRRKAKLFLCLRARFEIQTDVQTKPRDRKSVRVRHGVGAKRSEVSRGMTQNKFLIHNSEF